jgi:hypothetical protein
MSGYVPNPDDATQPTDPIIAETAAAEFRALKAKVNNLSSGAIQGSGLQNILINGDFQYNQINGVTTVNLPAAAGQIYISDMWNIGSNGITVNSLRATTVGPATPGFAQPPNYGSYESFAITTPVGSIATGTFFEICQYVEGLNMRHMGFGTPDARPSTVLFYCRCSVPGLVMAGTIRSGAATRSYVFNFTTGAANVWTRYAINIPGDTVGGLTAYPLDNTQGAQITFTLACGATFKTAVPNAWHAGNFIGTSTPDSANFLANPVNSTIEFTGVEWRPGTYTVANPVEIVPFQITDLLATRYYWVDDVGIVAGQTAYVTFHTFMRRAPIVTFTPAGMTLAGLTARSLAIFNNTGVTQTCHVIADARLDVT